MTKIKKFINRLLCKHDYKWYRELHESGFRALNSETHVLYCDKCNHIKERISVRI